MGTPLHMWDIDPQEAVRLQIALSRQVVEAWDGRPVRTVAGADVHQRGGKAAASICVMSFPELSVVDRAAYLWSTPFPYVPGLLAFREGPALLRAWEHLRVLPDLLLFDGHGRAHPRGFGLASHMGVWLGRPSIGVAKSRLCGRHSDVGPLAGDSTDLWDEGDPHRILGRVLRTHPRMKPVYVSVGHLIDLEHAVEFVRQCLRGHRIPEPCRLAHQLARRASLARDTDSAC